MPTSAKGTTVAQANSECTLITIDMLCFLFLAVDPCEEAGCNSSCLVPTDGNPVCYCASGYALDEERSNCVGELSPFLMNSPFP